MIPDSWHGTGAACRWIPSDRSRRYLWYTFNLYTPYKRSERVANVLIALWERSESDLDAVRAHRSQRERIGSALRAR